MEGDESYMKQMNADEILQKIQTAITEWHQKNEHRPKDAVIVTDEIRRIRPLGEHRDEIEPIVYELAIANTEMWHEEDKIRSEKDDVVLRAIRNVNPLNQHRNDLIEEIDEIILDQQNKGE